eukprot:g12858.t1
MILLLCLHYVVPLLFDSHSDAALCAVLAATLLAWWATTK